MVDAVDLEAKPRGHWSAGVLVDNLKLGYKMKSPSLQEMGNLRN